MYSSSYYDITQKVSEIRSMLVQLIVLYDKKANKKDIKNRITDIKGNLMKLYFSIEDLPFSEFEESTKTSFLSCILDMRTKLNKPDTDITDATISVNVCVSIEKYYTKKSKNI